MGAISRLQLKEEIICNHITNCKLLTRRKFLNSRSRPGFFNDGFTTAVFQVSSKYPVCKERLTILVMAGRSESKHEDARFVLSRCNHMTNCLSQAWHWNSGKIQYHEIQIPGWARALTARMPFSFDLILVILAIKKLTHIVCQK